jgi:hypothetical protein
LQDNLHNWRPNATFDAQETPVLQDILPNRVNLR